MFFINYIITELSSVSMFLFQLNEISESFATKKISQNALINKRINDDDETVQTAAKYKCLN